MKHILNRLTLGALALAGCSFGLRAADATAQEPIIEFRTVVAEQAGTDNFSFRIGATEDIYLDVDCGLGPIEVEVSQASYDQDSQSITATSVSCQTDANGIVKIYGDASKIDYLDLEGCYITDIKWPSLTELQVLNVCHNEFLSLDLSHMTKLEALYLDDNPFTDSPVKIGANKPNLTIFSANVVGNFDPEFDMTNYPELRSFVAFSTPTLTRLDPTNCSKLMQLSIDVTNVASLDLTKNPYLLVLNVSDTRVTNLDLSGNPVLSELYCSHSGALNTDCKLTSLDLSHNPQLIRLYCGGNNLTELDLSALPALQSLDCSRNQLTSIDISKNEQLFSVDISKNNMDFVTIPAERNSFIDYYYDQRPFVVDKQYAAGTVLDFTAKVNRPESTTSAVLYAYKEDKPSDPEILGDEYFTWDNGKITLKEACADSVYVAFKNTALPMYVLTTDKFAVKSAEDFGKPSAVATVRLAPTVRNYTLSVGLAGATAEAPRSFSVDFGDGNLVDFQATGNGTPATANVTGAKPTGANGTVTIYLPDGEQLTALAIDGQRTLSIDLSAARALSELTLRSCGLTALDLSWNRRLALLDLSGNSLSSLDLSGVNNAYDKTALTNLNVSGNAMSEFIFNDARSLIDADFSNNSFIDLSLAKMANLRTLNLSDNKLTEVDLRDLEAIEELNLANNELTAVTLLDYLPLRKLDLSGNKFTFAALPATDCVAEYIYAPQAEISQPAKAPVVSLYDYLFATEAGNTVFTWMMADTNTPVADGNIRENDGRFFFTNPDLGKVYCTLSNPAFPDFTGENVMRTTVVETAPMPTHVFATFTPVNDGTGSLSLAANTKGSAVYIDWTGEGDMEQYLLNDSYTVYEGRIMAGKQAKCYSYDENDDVKVFSITCGALSQLDASAMKGLTAFMAYNTGLEAADLKLPTSSTLTELTLSGAKLTSTDFLSDFPELVMLALSGNPLSNPDFSAVKKLQSLSCTGSELTTIKFDNPALWDLHLESNLFETIDLSGIPAMEQLFLAGNKLNSIDVSSLKSLKVLNLDNNCLTFATLPMPDASWYLYSYLGQQSLPISVADGKVDLSAQASVNGTDTEYRWYIDSPYLDENNELAGEELIEGEEYTIENGVTTFLTSQQHIMCVMTNALFPNLFLLTDFVDVTVSGVENVEVSDADAPVEYYNLQGIRVARPTAGNIYIRRQGNTASKVRM